MSKHIFNTETTEGRKVQVDIGYDPRLENFFGTVTCIDHSGKFEDAGEVLFTSMEMSDVEVLGANRIVERIEDMGISLPDEMVTEVLLDSTNHVSIKIVEHSVVDGKHVREQLHPKE